MQRWLHETDCVTQIACDTWREYSHVPLGFCFCLVAWLLSCLVAFAMLSCSCIIRLTLKYLQLFLFIFHLLVVCIFPFPYFCQLAQARNPFMAYLLSYYVWLLLSCLLLLSFAFAFTLAFAFYFVFAFALLLLLLLLLVNCPMISPTPSNV